MSDVTAQIVGTLGLGIGPLGAPELIVILVLGLLIFGKRLPEVGKSLGKGIVEFKKGLQGIHDDLDEVGKASKKLEDPKARSSESVSTESHEKTQA